MSIRAIQAVWDHSLQKGARRLLMLAIADYANEDGVAWPKLETLAQKCACSRAYVKKMLPDLKEAGELEVTERPRQGERSQTNLYRILLPNAAGRRIGDTPVTPRGNPSNPTGVTPVAPEPSMEPSFKPITELGTNSVGPHERAFANTSKPNPKPNPFEKPPPKNNEMRSKGNSERDNGSRASPNPQYVCPYCSRLYKRRGDLKRHVRTKHGDDPDHPAIQVYRELAGKDPVNGAQRTMIEGVEDVDVWRAAVIDWLGHGWRVDNVGGMMERYRERVKAQDNAKPTERRIVRR